MAVNLASKFAPKVDERFRLESLTDAGVNKEFEWVGVNAINILTLSSVALADYTRTGTARFGAPVELQDTKQTMTITKDRGNSIVVDKGNNLQQLGLKTAGKILAMQTSEIVIPEVDVYRLAAMGTAAVANSRKLATGASSASNAYTTVLTLQGSLSNDLVPLKNRILFVTPAFLNFLKLDPNFTKASDLAYTSLVNGQVGEVDGAKIVVVPSVYFPANTDVILAHSSVTVAAEQLNDFQTHMDPPGISGMQIDYRIIYDAFVRTPKVNGLAVHMSI
ncbi:MAG: N4-gp56 family major capsid protein [Candidatus Saccharibacteria bacterium]|nr:N4-gp56 family major capsid protein [Candidatus Saccharibacteria bacterium]